MTNRKFERAARLNRLIAVFFTAVFHVGLIGFVGMYSDGNLEKYLPETVKEWVGMNEDHMEETDQPRP